MALHLFELHARTAWRLGWVLHQERIMNPTSAKEMRDKVIDEALDEALDAVWKDLGIVAPPSR